MCFTVDNKPTVWFVLQIVKSCLEIPDIVKLFKENNGMIETILTINEKIELEYAIYKSMTVNNIKNRKFQLRDDI